MNLSWFPGHMAKAKRNIEAKLKLVDIVWEVVDARLPCSSHNPFAIKNKQRIILINKCDLADDKRLSEWIAWFKSKNLLALPVNGQTGAGMGLVVHHAKMLMHEQFKRREIRGIVSQKIRVMIAGIPNVGKSALINRLANRSMAITGNRPGVTRGEQWIKIGQELELLDTPGILWPKFASPQMGMNLAISGAIKSEILPTEEVALYLLAYLKEKYPELLASRYNLTDTSRATEELLADIALKRGCLLQGGVIDLERAASILLDDFKAARIGKITLEHPSEVEIKNG